MVGIRHRAFRLSCSLGRRGRCASPSTAATKDCRRCSEREPAVSLRDKSNVIGGWVPSLTCSSGMIHATTKLLRCLLLVEIGCVVSSAILDIVFEDTLPTEMRQYIARAEEAPMTT